MMYYDAAVEVLRAASRPLTVQEITDQAVEAGLIAPHGKTPVATMRAALYRPGSRRKLVKLEDPGETRAKPGSVRRTLRPN